MYTLFNKVYPQNFKNQQKLDHKLMKLSNYTPHFGYDQPKYVYLNPKKIRLEKIPKSLF